MQLDALRREENYNKAIRLTLPRTRRRTCYFHYAWLQQETVLSESESQTEDK